MPIQNRLERDARVIIETWSGTITIRDVDEYWHRLLTDPEALELRRTIADLRDADIAFSGAELEALVRRYVVPTLAGRTWRTAIVVAHPVQFGVSRQHEAFAERYSESEIFDDVSKAMVWMSAQ